jgi:hypothetical protein
MNSVRYMLITVLIALLSMLCQNSHCRAVSLVHEWGDGGEDEFKNTVLLTDGINEVYSLEKYANSADSSFKTQIRSRRVKMARRIMANQISEIPSQPVKVNKYHCFGLIENEWIKLIRGDFQELCDYFRANSFHGNMDSEYRYYDYEYRSDNENKYDFDFGDLFKPDIFTHAVRLYLNEHEDEILGAINNSEICSECKGFLYFYFWFTKHQLDTSKEEFRERANAIALEICDQIKDKNLRKFIKSFAITGDKYWGLQFSMDNSFIYEIPVGTNEIGLRSRIPSYEIGIGFGYRNFFFQANVNMGGMRTTTDIWLIDSIIPKGTRAMRNGIDLQLYYDFRLNNHWALGPTIGYQYSGLTFPRLNASTNGYSYGVRVLYYFNRKPERDTHESHYQQDGVAFFSAPNWQSTFILTQIMAEVCSYR